VSEKDAAALTVREMRPGEEAFCVALTLSVWEKVSVLKNATDRFGCVNGHPWTDHKADQILSELNRADVVLVGELGGVPVTFATLLYDRKYSTGMIGHLGVSAEVQNKGLGRAMVRAALDRMRRDGLKCARIESLVQNPRACHLYQSEGFEEVGRSVIFFRPL